MPATSTTAPTSTSTVAATTTTAAGATTTSSTVPASGPPTIRATPQQVTPGQSVTVTGTGFPPAIPVVAELFSNPVVLGSTVTDANGAFTLVVTIPTDTTPGLHTLQVRTTSSTVSARTTLAVTTPVATTAARVTAGALSRTGIEVTGRARPAIGLMVAGVVFLRVLWRRRSTAKPRWRGGRRRW